MSELYNWTKFYKLLAISTFGSWVNHTKMREVTTGLWGRTDELYCAILDYFSTKFSCHMTLTEQKEL